MEVRGAQIFQVEEKVFDFISTAKSDVSNWYCIHAYFIEIQMREKYGFFDFSSFFMLLDRFLLSQHRKIERFCCIYHPRTRATQPNSSENPMKKSKNRKIRIFPLFEFL